MLTQQPSWLPKFKEFVGTHAENIRDMFRKGRNRGQFIQGHEFHSHKQKEVV